MRTSVDVARVEKRAISVDRGLILVYKQGGPVTCFTQNRRAGEARRRVTWRRSTFSPALL